MSNVTTLTLTRTFLTEWTTVFVITLILQSKVQAIDLTKEAIVTVGCNTISTTIHEVVSASIGIATKFWQHIGPCFDVIYDTVVTTIVESTILTKA
ncbi:Uncharacterised protein [Escherichia coli]|nr:Uncharacterised protein [Escherichia coli]